ncbi:MAG: AraC family transcriptional regulator [Xanthobacteraceae bacterium]
MTNGEFNILRCSMSGANAVVSNTRHIFPRHTHEQFGIGVIEWGAQKSWSGRGLVEASAGDAITVNPGEVHDGAPIGGAGRAWPMLYFDPPLVAQAMHDMSEGKARSYEFYDPVIKDARVSACFQRLFTACTSAGERQVLRRDELLLALLPKVATQQNLPLVERFFPKAISLAKSLIDDRPASAVTLSDLARASGLSKFQLLRGFVRATGLTPHTYVMQRRIELARRLIARRVGLAEAALSSGFADQSHMTRIFVRNYGISPGAYARVMN